MANEADIFSSRYIKDEFAQSDIVYTRGERLFFLGNYSLVSKEGEAYEYTFDGNHGTYNVKVVVGKGGYTTSCSCPYPHKGCKHAVAALLDIQKRRSRSALDSAALRASEEYLTPEEIRDIAIASRRERAKTEKFSLIAGETFKGEHTVVTERGDRYKVVFYDPSTGRGHCSCPDFRTNSLDLCKHLLFAEARLKKNPDFAVQVARERFPFVHIAWSSRHESPYCYFESVDDSELEKRLHALFGEKGIYTRESMGPLFKLYQEAGEDGPLRFDEYLLDRMEDLQHGKELAKIAERTTLDFSFLKTTLYPYQAEGVRFAVFRRAAVIADEMGLGKTLQAIATAVLKADLFGFTKVLVVAPSSLKEQWKREIEKFTDRKALVVAGSRQTRQRLIVENETLFKITNYEAVLRDVAALRRWKPDLVILDEAQRIKNFETKTHQALLSIPRLHSLVVTGTPLENKLEDVYSIAQFSRPTMFAPLWAFAANYYNMDKDRKKVVGYRNLDTIRDKLKDLVIRRRKEEVFSELPEEIDNTYYLEMSTEQAEIHQGYLASLLPLLNKKVLTPMDIKRMQMILLSMRMVCDSTYLIDKETNVSPKLAELATILKEVVIDNGRKAIIFSEWTTMTYLIGKVLSEMAIDFVEFTGKIPVEKRQRLITEFQENPDCRVFLSTDAGGVGLNLQNADCVVNFDLPWNPAKLNQRIGRVNRIGQKSRTVNVVNLVMKNSLEMNVLSGINMKQDLFDAVLENGADEVDFSRKSRDRFLNAVRALIGEEAKTTSERRIAPELEEDTPHYLNPKALVDVAAEVDLGREEEGLEGGVRNLAGAGNVPSEPGVSAMGAPGEGAVEPGPSAETSAFPSARPAVPAANMEAVLNQGLAFLNSLSLLATGKALVPDSDKASVSVDADTGEVVLRFKLPT